MSFLQLHITSLMLTQWTNSSGLLELGLKSASHFLPPKNRIFILICFGCFTGQEN